MSVGVIIVAVIAIAVVAYIAFRKKSAAPAAAPTSTAPGKPEGKKNLPN